MSGSFAALDAAPASAATSSISGTVTAAAGGAALPGICVAAFQRGLDSTLLASTATDNTGAYTLTSVPTGNVDVKFYSSGLCPGGVASNYVTQWYNDQLTESTANQVAVVDGTPTTGINAALVVGGTIKGKVTAASGGAGINGACVGAYQPGLDPLLVASNSTNPDGTYTLDGVPAGTIEVQFYTTGFCPGGIANDFASQWWDHKVDEASATSINVVAGATNANINGSLAAAGKISGTVTAAAGGAGINGLCVEAFTHGIEPQQLVASTGSNPDGTYTLTGVPVGQVDVEFKSSGFCPGGIASNYSTQWYNNQLDQASANPVTVTAGATTPNINASLVAGGSISGTVTAAAGGAGLKGICVSAYQHAVLHPPVLIASVGTFADGTYTLDGVPAGNVDVEFSSTRNCPGAVNGTFVTQWYNGQPDQNTSNTVNVTAGATTPGIDAAMVAGGTVTGKVTAAVGGAGLGGICVQAYSGVFVVASVGTTPTGTYALPGMPTGGVKVNFNGDGFCPGGVVRPYNPQWYNNKASQAAADDVNVTVGGTTPNINAALTRPTTNAPFTIKVNGSSTSATVSKGTAATLSEVGIPGTATGTVVFSAPGNPSLCTITLPSTSCRTSSALGVGTYNPITAVFTDTDGGFDSGASTNTVSLTVKAVAPDAPTNVHAKVSHGVVTVTWTAPANNGAAITGYTVKAAPGGATVNVGNTTKATVSGLAAGTYSFTVRAKNAAGTSVASAASNNVTISSASSAAGAGYWMLGSDGHVYPFGGAGKFGNGMNHAVAMASKLDGTGYWVVDGLGNVRHFGSAAGHGGRPALRAGEAVSAISVTPTGNGYWLFTNLGRAFAYGDAHFYGDMGKVKLNGPVIASAATATGHGYFMVGSDGGVFTFGDAKFHGSTGNMRLDKPVVGISPTPDNQGYWLVASDGGVFAFKAPFRGSMGGKHLNRPVNGLIAFGNGYLMVASDGGIFNFSNKPFFGSLGNNPPAAPIIGIAAFTTK